MQKAIIFILLFSISLTSYGQRGKEESNSSNSEQEKIIIEVETDEISTNSQIFNKNSNADFYIRLKKANVGVWVDTSKWEIDKADTHLTFKYKTSYSTELHLYYFTTKRTDIENCNLQIEIWENVFKNFNLISKEYREVNGTKIIFLDIEGRYGTTPETMIGYHKAVGNGTITFRCVIATQNISAFENDIIELLNGLVIE